MNFSELDIEEKLKTFHYSDSRLSVIDSPHHLERFASLIHRVARESITISQIKENITDDLIDINHKNFNPMVLAMWHYQENNINEAYWLLFLCSYIAKYLDQDHNLIQNIYGALENKRIWTWEKVSNHIKDFKIWLQTNQPILTKKGKLGDIYKEPSFSQHRAAVMGNDIESYVNWISSHQLSNIIKNQSTGNFDQLYQSMNRSIACDKFITFDFIALLENIGISKITPTNLYLNEIMLPKKAAKLIVYGEKKLQRVSLLELNEIMISLVNHLDLPFGFKVIQAVLVKLGADKYWSKGQNFRKPYNRK